MHPHLRDSMQFLYMKDDTGYEEFPAAVFEAETEGSEGKIDSTKAKALTVEKVSENSNHNLLKDLKQQIESIAMIMKSPTLEILNLRWVVGPPPQGKRKCLVILFRNLLQGPPKDLRDLELMLQDLLDLDKNL